MTTLFGRMALASVVIAMLAGGPLLAQPPEHKTGGYVQTATLDYSTPKPPELASPQGQKDIKAVRDAQSSIGQSSVGQSSNEARHRQAFEDAGAYGYDQLITRFSQAAGTSLDVQSRPILGHMLKRLLVDTGNFIGDAKFAHPRLRPYKEDRTIVPCETDYLYPTDGSSYPSGHAANGYVAARLISEVITPADEPDRRPGLLARGQRYGDNRVVCGVHHPSDVKEGRTLAEHIYDRAAATAEFQADLACAKEETERSPGGRRTDHPAAYSPACQAMSDHDALEVTRKSG